MPMPALPGSVQSGDSEPLEAAETTVPAEAAEPPAASAVAEAATPAQ
jgi:hypothetical protein